MLRFGSDNAGKVVILSAWIWPRKELQNQNEDIKRWREFSDLRPNATFLMSFFMGEIK